MKIYMTPSEMMNKNLWYRYCELTGTSEHACNEGNMDSHESVQLPVEMGTYVQSKF